MKGMPPFLKLLSFVGTIAMLWVGGGILIHSLAIYGFDGPEHVIHDVSEAVRCCCSRGIRLLGLADRDTRLRRRRFGRRRHYGCRGRSVKPLFGVRAAH